MGGEGVTVRGGGVAAGGVCRGSRGHARQGEPTRVCGGLSQRWEGGRIITHAQSLGRVRGGGGSPHTPTPHAPPDPQSCFKEGKLILRERRGGARGLGAGCAQMGAEPLK